MDRKRYILAGTGSRGLGMFGKPVTFDDELKPHAEIVGLHDVSPARMDFVRRQLEKPGGFPCSTDFDQLASQVEFDGVIVATKDCAHAGVILKGLARGKRVFCEKPVCVDEAQVRAILAAEKASAGEVFVTHNVRYSPGFGKVKEVIDDGLIGDLLFVEYNDYLDRHHGADYFRRWHGVKANSGGLAVHKASHHYDILNYIVGSVAKTMYATGGLSFYGKNGKFRGERCSGCDHADECDFHADVFTHEISVGLYRDAEADSGYLRDGCVFREELTTEDNYHSVFEYENGVRGVYTLVAYCPFEGQRIVFSGTRGRIEFVAIGSADWAPGTNATPGLAASAGRSLRAYMPGEGIREIEIPKVTGGHGGSDPALRHEFFVKSWQGGERSPQMASLMEGCQAVLMGAAANVSMAEGRVVDVQGLLSE